MAFGNVCVEVDRNPKFRSCGCCHVRTAALILGMYNFVVHSFAVCFLIFAAFEPNILYNLNQQTFNGHLEANDTPREASDPLVDFKLEDLPSLPTPMPREFYWQPIGRDNKILIFRSDILGTMPRRVIVGDVNLAIAFIMGMMFITTLMIYGVLKSRPFYLIPFFCFQIFDFIISCLTVVDHNTLAQSVENSIRDDINLSVAQAKSVKIIDCHWLVLFVLFAYSIVLLIKVYFIGIIWSCYQYLKYVNKKNCDRTLDYAADKQYMDTKSVPYDYDAPPPAYPSAEV